MSAPGGVSALGGVSAPGGMVSQHAPRQTPLPVNRMTDRCKNITLATTSLRPVKITLEIAFVIFYPKAMGSKTFRINPRVFRTFNFETMILIV